MHINRKYKGVSLEPFIRVKDAVHTALRKQMTQTFSSFKCETGHSCAAGAICGLSGPMAQLYFTCNFYHYILLLFTVAHLYIPFHFLIFFPDENLPEAFFVLIDVLLFFLLLLVLFHFFVRKLDKIDKLRYIRTTEIQRSREKWDYGSGKQFKFVQTPSKAAWNAGRVPPRCNCLVSYFVCFWVV